MSIITESSRLLPQSYDDPNNLTSSRSADSANVTYERSSIRDLRQFESSLESGNMRDTFVETADCRPCCSDSYAKSIVFGGYDGVISALAIISGAFGGELSWKIILIIGVSNVVANSLTIGISEFMSSKAHKNFLQAEKRRELWEFKNFRDAEIIQMTNRFEARGMARRDAELVVSKMAQYESFFVGLMVSEELGMQVTDDDDASLISDAFSMFISFCVFGMLPIAIYCFAPVFQLSAQMLYYSTVTFSLILLCILGIIKSSFCNSFSWFSAVEALIHGLIAIVSSYFIGYFIMVILDDFN